jgi:MFS family permease
MSPREVFWHTTWRDRNLASVCQAGLVNNLNDGMAWGLFPLFFAAAQMDLGQIGTLAAIYPATWGVAQLVTGAWSDRVGQEVADRHRHVRPRRSASGWSPVLEQASVGFALGGVLLGLGTAMVYPTLLAAIGDVAHPSWRASAVGVYRLWRDLGYAVGAVLAGLTADALGLPWAMSVVAGLTLASGVVVAARMRETRRSTPAVPVAGEEPEVLRQQQEPPVPDRPRSARQCP